MMYLSERQSAGLTRRSPVQIAGLALLAALILAGLLLPGCGGLPEPPTRVFLVVDSARRSLETRVTTVGQLLDETNVVLQGLDRVAPPETTLISDGMTITVTRVTERLEILTETLAFGRQTVRDATVPENETRLLQAGVPGVREKTYRIVSEDGVETERTLVKDAITHMPQDEVMLVGTRPLAMTSTITGALAYLAQQDAWLIRNTTASQRRLTALGDLDGRVFALSPDSERLLFTRGVTETTHFNALWLIYTTEVDAEPIALELYDVLWADWAPDNERIAWTTAELADREPGWRGRNDLWIGTFTSRDALIGRRELLAPEAGGGYGWWGTRYAWSPTEDALAYARPDGVGIVDVRQRERRSLATFPVFRTYSSWAWVPGITWSPEGDILVTVVHGEAPGQEDPEESPVFNLLALEPTGVFSAELSAETGMWANPQFSHDGETLLFGRAEIPFQSQVSPYALCTLDRDGSNRVCFYPDDSEPALEIPVWVWSPDRTSIAIIQQENLSLLPVGAHYAVTVTDKGDVIAIDWQ
ncbi:MAG: G5 domain-containing protein [Anaerolineae bacterium]|nr:G5 domain-containing protein [Anaerolineae bacterium]